MEKRPARRSRILQLSRSAAPWLLLASVWLAPTRASADDADDDYAVAAGLYKRMRWDLAGANFQKFLEKYPQHPQAPSARFYGGLALVYDQKYRPARDLLRRYLQDNPPDANRPDTLYRIAECSYLLDDLAAAEPELTAFAARYAEHPLGERAWPYLGDVQLRGGKAAAAEKSFRRALELFPQGVMADDCRFGLARSYEAQQKPAEAAKLYEQLAADPQGPRAAEAQLHLGARHFDDRRFDQAAAAYARLEQTFPQSPLVPTARLNRGYALFQSGQFAAAAEQFARAAEHPPQALEAGYWQGLSWKGQRDWAQAVAVLQKVYQAHRTAPLAENVLYHWAEAEQQQGHGAAARKLFLELVERWPQGQLADDSLHLAAVLAVEEGHLDEAETLVQRFQKQYPGSGLRWHTEVLKGRLDLLRGRGTQAVATFERVLQNSESEVTKGWAAYYLAYAHQQAGRDAEALRVTAPWATSETPAQWPPGLWAVHVLRGVSHLALARAEQAKLAAEGVQGTPLRERTRAAFEAAAASATRYLETLPQGEQAPLALAVRARAAAHAGNKVAAERDLASLAQQFPEHVELDKTRYELAEVAYANEDWEWAATLFGELAAEGRQTSPYYARGLVGQAWSLYKRKDFARAAQAFARSVAEFPQAETAAEAAFMRGRALQDGEDLEGALRAYREALDRYAPQKHAFLAGLQAARLLGEQSSVDTADAAYQKLLERCPRPEGLDRVLDEWALLNYSAQRFARSDEVFRRLVRDVPQSDLADNAQLSLAESDLLAGKLDEAERAFRKLEASPQSDPGVQQTALFHLLNLAVERKQVPAVRAAARQLIDRFPQAAQRWFAEFRLAEADLQSDQTSAAVMRLQNVVAQTQPEVTSAKWFPEAWILLAEAYVRQKQYAHVADTVAKFRTALPESELLYVADEVLGRSWKAQAKFPEAREAFERVVRHPAGRRTETAAKSQLMIAETYLLEKKFKEAEEAYLKVDILYDFPDWQAPALYQVAACQEATQRWADAVRTYTLLIERFPQSTYATMARARLTAARSKAAGK